MINSQDVTGGQASAFSKSADPSNPKKEVSRRQIIFAAAFGNFVEFFDFTVFATFAVIIGKVFFPSGDSATDLLSALATFGVGFFMRPVGGVVIGYYADKIGRKPAMILTLSLMTISTLMIACAPSYALAGVWGAVILVLARLLQGFAAGGEVGASTSMLVEAAPKNRRGLYSSWQLATQGGSTMFGGILATILFATLDAEQMSSWGWRIPFAIGAILGPIGLILRLRIEVVAEEPKAEQKAIETESSFSLLIQHFKPIILGVLLTIGSTISIYLSLYFYSTLGAKFLNISSTYTSAAILMTGFINLVLSPVAGYLSDIYGRKPLIIISRWLMLVFAVPSFWLLVNWPTPVVLFFVVIVMASIATIAAAPSVLMISELFPRKIRALAFSIVYSVGVAIFGGFAQFFATELIVLTESYISPSIYMIFGCLVSIIALIYIEDQYKNDLK
ncbi:MFS transporter [Microvirga sp. W0021]|uniref:MFS transporter n=1 Tax=Hohaiivirga grylli TaxID=3133970 RepID=A0ABV0BK51_9HYPH